MTYDQAANLRSRLKTPEQTIENAKTISVVSGKGGVGKSNIALNIAIDLSQRDYRVLVMDLDVGMGNIDILVGQHTDNSIVDMLHDNMPIQDIITEGPAGLSYISGGTGFADFFTMDQMKINYFLQEFEKLKRMYDYIFFDMGAGATSDSIFFILASEECILITTPEPTALTDAYAMVKKILYRDNEMSISIIMNRVREIRQGKIILDKFQTIIRKFLHVETHALGILPDDPIVREAVSGQTPFILWKGKAPISKSLRQITEKYTNGKGLQNKRSSSFVQKLRRLLLER